MTVQELSRAQLTELKQNYYTHVLHSGTGVSYGELANINTLVSDKEICDYYQDTEFVEDDFWA